jgi:hypothetical protein
VGACLPRTGVFSHCININYCSSLKITVLLFLSHLQHVINARTTEQRRKKRPGAVSRRVRRRRSRNPPATKRSTIPTIDELVASVMHIPLHRRARSLRELLQHHVRLSLADNHTATPTAAREALLLWSTMAVPPSTPAIPVDDEPPNVVVSSAPVPTSTRTPPARIQVANVAYCDAHGWTAVVQVPVVLCDLPLDESTPPVTGAVPASSAGEPVEVHMDATRAPSPVAGHRRGRSPSSPPSPPPQTAPRVNGPATAAGRPVINGHT